MPANSEYQFEFTRPQAPRHDPYDNQLGEAEWEDGPYPRDCRSTRHELLSVSGAEALKFCPAGADKDRYGLPRSMSICGCRLRRSVLAVLTVLPGMLRTPFLT